MGITEIKELVLFASSIAELIEGLADGLGVGDLGKALEVAREAKPALDKAGEAWDEYLAMSEEEAAELEAYTVDVLDLDNQDVEVAIETVMKALIALHGLVSLFPKKSV